MKVLSLIVFIFYLGCTQMVNFIPKNVIRHTPWKDIIDGYIKNKAVFVVSKSWCPASKKVKDVLKKYDFIPRLVQILEIDKLDQITTKKIENYMMQLTGSSYVPRVFIGGQFFGDEFKIQKAHKSGTLRNILQTAGALDFPVA